MKKDVIHADSVITGQHRNSCERYPCDQCTYKATLTYNLKENIKTIHEGNSYTCSMCDYNGADRSGLRKHKFRIVQT